MVQESVYLFIFYYADNVIYILKGQFHFIWYKSFKLVCQKAGAEVHSSDWDEKCLLIEKPI